MQASPPEPLQGTRILLTRKAAGSDTLSEHLSGWGATALHYPLLAIHPVTFQPLSLKDYDWLFFTSQEAVNHFNEGFFQLNLQSVSWPPVGVVGPETARALSGLGHSPAFVPPRFSAEAAAEAFVRAHSVAGLKILWPCGNRANSRFSEILKAHGAHVDHLIVYETCSQVASPPTPEEAGRMAAMFHPGLSVVVFTSPSAVEVFASFAQPLGTTRVACIGPSTRRAAQTLLGRCDIMGDPHTQAGLAQAILAALGGE